jgi:hypothetical protein
MIGQLRCASPCCIHTKEEQTPCSLIIKIAAVALGGIALLVGILALCGIPGLNGLGNVGGAVLIPSGILILLVGLCLRCVKDGGLGANLQLRGIQYADGSYSESSKGTFTTGGRTFTDSQSYCNLEQFLASTNPADVAMCERLKQELVVTDLDFRMKENFDNNKFVLVLPLNYVNEIRDDELLFQTLKLIYLPTSDLLNHPLKVIEAYNDDQKNILSLRLDFMKDIPPSATPGTLGAFLGYKKELLTMPPALYLFFTKEQVMFFLQHAAIDKQTVEALFPPGRRLLIFTAMRSARVLSELPTVHKILHLLSGRLVWLLIDKRGAELDYSLLTDEQVDEMLPTTLTVRDASINKMKHLPIEILNALLPKMKCQLCLIPDNRLEDKKLDLNSLVENQVERMFPTGFMEKDKSRQRMGHLHIDVLNQILPKMSGEQLRCVPDNHLENSQLNLRTLSQKQIRSMFPTSSMEKDKSMKRFNALARDNRDYVQTIVNFSNTLY